MLLLRARGPDPRVRRGVVLAGVIEDQGVVVRHERDPFDLRVASIEGGRITLETTSETASNRFWDSPALDFESLVDDGASRQRPAGMRLPDALTALAKSLAAARFGIDYRAMDYLERAEALSAPILLFHGSGDTRVPISLSDRLAEARPEGT